MWSKWRYAGREILVGEAQAPPSSVAPHRRQDSQNRPEAIPEPKRFDLRLYLRTYSI
jgi:hypothetical protein